MGNYDYSGWFVMLLGMGTVFVGLIGLILITMLMSFFCAKVKGSEQEKSAVLPSRAPSTSVVLNRPVLAAAISAAIAEYMGTDPNGLRILSIKRMGGVAEDRGALVAAVSAALATDMGKDISGLRIHSLKQI